MEVSGSLYLCFEISLRMTAEQSLPSCDIFWIFPGFFPWPGCLRASPYVAVLHQASPKCCSRNSYHPVPAGSCCSFNMVLPAGPAGTVGRHRACVRLSLGCRGCTALSSLPGKAEQRELCGEGCVGMQGAEKRGVPPLWCVIDGRSQPGKLVLCSVVPAAWRGWE